MQVCHHISFAIIFSFRRITSAPGPHLRKLLPVLAGNDLGDWHLAGKNTLTVTHRNRSPICGICAGNLGVISSMRSIFPYVQVTFCLMFYPEAGPPVVGRDPERGCVFGAPGTVRPKPSLKSLLMAPPGTRWTRVSPADQGLIFRAYLVLLTIRVTKNDNTDCYHVVGPWPPFVANRRYTDPGQRLVHFLEYRRSSVLAPNPQRPVRSKFQDLWHSLVLASHSPYISEFVRRVLCIWGGIGMPYTRNYVDEYMSPQAMPRLAPPNFSSSPYQCVVQFSEEIQRRRRSRQEKANDVGGSPPWTP